MTSHRSPRLLSVPDPHALALSVRASCFVVEDAASKAVVSQAERIAASDATALIGRWFIVFSKSTVLASDSSM